MTARAGGSSSGGTSTLEDLVTADSIEWYGHSYVQGYLLGAPHERFTSLVAEACGIREIRHATGGQEMAGNSFSSTPGYGTVFQYADASHRSIIETPWNNPNRIYGVYWGINDVGLGKVSADCYARVARVVISRLRSYFIAEHGDSSVALGGSWTSRTTANFLASGNDYTEPQATSTTVTISVPSWFPGGTVALGTYSITDGTGACAAGSDWSITVDGGAAVTFNNRTAAGYANASGPNPHVYRLTGLAAGAHTIVMTVTARTGAGGGFDYWQAEAQTPPYVLWGLCARLDVSGYSNYATAYSQTAGDALVIAQNDAIRTLINGEFDGYVLAVEADPAWGRLKSGTTGEVSNTGPFDHLHPNRYGAAVLASAFVKKLKARLG